MIAMVLKSLRKICSWRTLTSFILIINGLQYLFFNFRSAYLMTQKTNAEFFGVFTYPTLFMILILAFVNFLSSWGIWRGRRWAFFLTIGLVVISLFRAVPIMLYIPAFILRGGFSFVYIFYICFKGRVLMLLVPIGLYKMRDEFSRKEGS